MLFERKGGVLANRDLHSSLHTTAGFASKGLEIDRIDARDGIRPWG